MDFGLVYPIIKLIKFDMRFEAQLIAIGGHVSTQFGGSKNVNEISGIPVDIALETYEADDSNLGIAKSMAITTQAIGEAFITLKPDVIVLAGDRYEMLAVAGTATVMGIPIIHLYGGDTSYGAYDENIRHAITKLAHIHFTSHEKARQRVIQMGEETKYVYNFGAPALSFLDDFSVMSKKSLSNDLGIEFGARNIIVTYHPVTRAKERIGALISALDTLVEKTNIFITMPNADNGGRKLYDVLKIFSKQHDNVWMFQSLGMKHYLSLLSHMDAVVGNSSSGLYEAPSFNVPTVNIGNRQRGRLAPASVIHCECDTKEILHAIESAYDLDCSIVSNPYYQAKTAQKIVNQIANLAPFKKLLAKEFCDYG